MYQCFKGQQKLCWQLLSTAPERLLFLASETLEDRYCQSIALYIQCSLHSKPHDQVKMDSRLFIVQTTGF